MTRILIIVDDRDREECPDKPWTATAYDPGDRPMREIANGATEYITVEAGLGRTVAEALASINIDADALGIPDGELVQREDAYYEAFKEDNT